MSDQPLANSAEARSPTGEILDPSTITPSPEPKPTSSTTPEPTSGEPKPTEVKPAIDPNAPKDPKEPAAKTEVPEKYEFKYPDGFKADDKAVEAASAKFKELGLTNDQAQSLMDTYVEQAKAAAEAPVNAYETLRQEWQKEAKTQHGTKLETEIRPAVSRAIDSLGPELATQFREALNITGAGDNPAVINALFKLAQSVNEGSLVTGRGPSPHGQNPSGSAKPENPGLAASMYPKLPRAGT